MKRFFFFLFCIIALLSFFWGISALFFDDLQTDIAKNDFNIVLITIDALRADHLSCYGYERDTSPTIDRIAEKGIIFKNAIAPSSWTAPSMASLFTSLYPINHGVINSIVGGGKVYSQDVFSDKLITLAEVLKAHGYTTLGVASNLHLSEYFGFGRGFDYFECLPWVGADRVNEVIYSWEKHIKESAKFFLWIHYFDPHHHYLPREPWIERYTSHSLTQKVKLFAKGMNELEGLIPTFKKDPQTLSNLIALYDSEINYVDSYIERLLNKFELEKNTLIIITADHGEEFLEHDAIGHGNNLYCETIRIPLILKLPYSSKKEVVEENVNLVDIMPSILHLLNISSPEETLGKTFWAKAISSEKEPVNYNFAELHTTSIKFNNLKMIMTPQWKYIYNYQDDSQELYNLKTDPLELNNLAGKEIKQSAQLKEKLFEWVSGTKKYPVTKKPFALSQEEKEKLKSLGYIE